MLRSRSFLLLALLLTCFGCGQDGPALGTVTGTVTIDGAPLVDADIQFLPVEGGRSSRAITDPEGKYELLHTVDRKGALLGQHKVVVNKYDDELLEEGKPAFVDVPECYNSDSVLKADVQAGDNTFDFKLNSKGE